MVPEQPANPLAKFFRQPAVYIKLPSNGRYWEDDALEIPVTGEIGIYPMTTKDELALKTPDALMNGQGVVDVIHSCVPAIKNAWKMPSVDVDAVLIAIRIASYGEFMEVTSKCPHCSEENEYEVDLKPILASVTVPDYQELLTYKSMKIKLKPQQYFSVNQANRVRFEEERLGNILANMDNVEPEAKAKLLKESMTRLLKVGFDMVAESVDYIEIDDGSRISNKLHLIEFFENVESSLVQAIQDRLVKMLESARLKPTSVQCGNSECVKPFDLALEFDQANFFGKGF